MGAGRAFASDRQGRLANPAGLLGRLLEALDEAKSTGRKVPSCRDLRARQRFEPGTLPVVEGARAAHRSEKHRLIPARAQKMVRFVRADGVFSGGDIKGLAFAGGLHAAADAGYDDWSKLAGTSAAAITPMALAVGYTARGRSGTPRRL